MDVMYQVGVQIAAYLTVIILAIAFINWITNGFIIPAMRVKLSRGRLTLGFINSMNGNYYRAGKISNGFFIYKDNEKEKHRVSVDGAECVGHIAGTKAVYVDEVSNICLKPDFTSGKGFDAVKYENLYVRALMSPDVQDKLMKVLVIGIILAAACSAVGLILIYRQGMQITTILNALASISSQVV